LSISERSCVPFFRLQAAWEIVRLPSSDRPSRARGTICSTVAAPGCGHRSVRSTSPEHTKQMPWQRIHSRCGLVPFLRAVALWRLRQPAEHHFCVTRTGTNSTPQEQVFGSLLGGFGLRFHWTAFIIRERQRREQNFRCVRAPFFSNACPQVAHSTITRFPDRETSRTGSGAVRGRTAREPHQRQGWPGPYRTCHPNGSCPKRDGCVR